jgi:hypothetical protein
VNHVEKTFALTQSVPKTFVRHPLNDDVLRSIRRRGEAVIALRADQFNFHNRFLPALYWFCPASEPTERVRLARVGPTHKEGLSEE